jgi:hypothetical protein
MKKMKVKVKIRNATLNSLSRNGDGTFDIRYTILQEQQSADLASEIAESIPKEGLAYYRKIRGVDYTFVCNQKTGEHMGCVMPCGFIWCECCDFVCQ